jgi:pimeloyl-ACP methyl ester carboxylesterase
MALISELRYPTKWYAKLIAAVLALVFFVLLATATISGFLVYRIVSPAHSRSDINVQAFPGRPNVVTFNVPGVGSREGWFFPGLKTAPTIILCHGYQSDRGELLTLVTALQDHQYNVFLFDFAAHGSSSGHTTLGYREAQELRAAVDAVARRGDVDRTRFGLWGTNLGAYAAVAVAAADPRVRAFVVESVYDRPADLLGLEVKRSGLAAFPLVQRFAQWDFEWWNYSYRHEPPLSARLARLAGVAKLYIQGSDEPELAQSTRELLVRSPEPREQVILPKANYAGMLDEEKRGYENRMVSFFLLKLPPSGSPAR